MTTQEVIENLYDFARERIDETEGFTNSPREKWKMVGKRELLADLFRYLKELSKDAII